MNGSAPKWFIPENATPLPPSQRDVTPILPAVGSEIEESTPLIPAATSEHSSTPSWEAIVEEPRAEGESKEVETPLEQRKTAEAEYFAELELIKASAQREVDQMGGATPDFIERAKQVIDSFPIDELLPKNPVEATVILNQLIVAAIEEVTAQQESKPTNGSDEDFSVSYRARLDSINPEALEGYPLQYQVLVLLPQLDSYNEPYLQIDNLQRILTLLITVHEADNQALFNTRDQLLSARNRWNEKEAAISAAETVTTAPVQE